MDAINLCMFNLCIIGVPNLLLWVYEIDMYLNYDAREDGNLIAENTLFEEDMCDIRRVLVN